MRKKIIDGKLALVLISVILFDQFTKLIVRYFLAKWNSVTFVPRLLSLTYFTNTGAGFGILGNRNFLLIIVTIIFITLLFYSYFKYYNDNLFFVLIIAGALSNLIDRLINGFVTDFIFFHFWPAFNVADIAITVGVVGFVLFEIKKKK